MRRAFLFICLVLGPGCVTTETRNTNHPVAPAVSTAPSRSWRGESDSGALVGYLVRFAEGPKSQAARGFFSVRNAYQQELGLVDDLGRSWRFEPHQKEPTWLGSGSVTEATGRILGMDVQLVETPLQELFAASVPKN